VIDSLQILNDTVRAQHGKESTAAGPGSTRLRTAECVGGCRQRLMPARNSKQGGNA